MMLTGFFFYPKPVPPTVNGASAKIEEPRLQSEASTDSTKGFAAAKICCDNWYSAVQWEGSNAKDTTQVRDQVRC